MNEGVDPLVVREPDVSDPDANAIRRGLLAEARDYGGGGLFGGLPDDVSWEWAALTPDELLAVRYIDYSYWVELSGGTRLPTDGCRRLREGIEPFGVPSAGFFELADELTAGERFSPPILGDGPAGSSCSRGMRGSPRTPLPRRPYRSSSRCWSGARRACPAGRCTDEPRRARLAAEPRRTSPRPATRALAPRASAARRGRPSSPCPQR